MPDVHMVWDGLSFWLELKIAKSNAVKLSSHQIAWNTAYWARGGANFILVKHAPSREILLFRGLDSGTVAQEGVSCAPAARVLSPAALFEALRPCVLDRYGEALRPCGPAALP